MSKLTSSHNSFQETQSSSTVQYNLNPFNLPSTMSYQGSRKHLPYMNALLIAISTILWIHTIPAGAALSLYSECAAATDPFSRITDKAGYVSTLLRLHANATRNVDYLETVPLVLAPILSVIESRIFVAVVSAPGTALRALSASPRTTWIRVTVLLSEVDGSSGAPSAKYYQVESKLSTNNGNSIISSIAAVLQSNYDPPVVVSTQSSYFDASWMCVKQSTVNSGNNNSLSWWVLLCLLVAVAVVIGTGIFLEYDRRKFNRERARRLAAARPNPLAEETKVTTTAQLELSERANQLKTFNMMYHSGTGSRSSFATATKNTTRASQRASLGYKPATKSMTKSSSPNTHSAAVGFSAASFQPKPRDSLDPKSVDSATKTSTPTSSRGSTTSISTNVPVQVAQRSMNPLLVRYAKKTSTEDKPPSTSQKPPS